MRRNAQKELEMEHMIEALRIEIKATNEQLLQKVEERMRNCASSAPDEDATVGVHTPDRVCQFQDHARGDLVAPGEVLKLGLRGQEVC
jgi:hypothetical protein